MAVTAASVLRPTADLKQGTGVRDESGSGAASCWIKVDDGGAVTDYTGADDATYLFGANNNQYPAVYVQLGLGDLAALGADQRIKQVRVRSRIRMNSLVAGDSAIVHFKLTDPQAGLGIPPPGTSEQSTSIDKVETGSTTVAPRTGAWHTQPPPLDGGEWTRDIINRLRVDLAWYYGQYGQVNLRVTEVYVDVDVRDQPTVSAVTASGYTSTTRPTITWDYVANVDSDPQVAWQAKVFSAAQYGAAGFDPASSLAVWDSGLRYGDDTQTPVGVDLANGATYKTYVRAAQDFNGERWWSDWAASSPFTVGVTPPPAPTLTVASDPTCPALRNQLTFASALNALAADDADLEGVGVGNWVAGVGITGLARSTAQASHGAASLALTYSATANPEARNTGNAGAGAMLVRPGQQVSANARVRASSTGRAARSGIRFHNDAETQVGSTIYGATVTDSSGAWSTTPTVTATAPAGATRAYLVDSLSATPAAAEVHYFDQHQLVPGASAPAWAPGFLASSGAVIERALAATELRNQATPQLSSGGDASGTTDGFFTTGTTSTVSYDQADRHAGVGSIRWEVEDTTAKLYLGWPSATLEDPAPADALACVPGRAYVFSVYAKAASSSFSSQLNLQAIDKGGTPVGAPTSGGAISILASGWTRFAATITAPAGAAYVRPHLDNTGAVTGRKVWVDSAQWELGTTAGELGAPGGVPLSWEPVRGFVPGAAPIGASQSLVAFDHEVAPGSTYLYRAWIYTLDPASSEALSSPFTAYQAALIDPPGAGQWMLSEVALLPLLRGCVCVLKGLTGSVNEDVTIYHPLRPRRPGQVGQRPVALSDWIGGHDGTLQIAGLGDDAWWLLERLVDSQLPLWFTSSQGGGRYVRLTDRAWTMTRWREGCLVLADGTTLPAGEWERTLTLTYVEADRPPDTAPILIAPEEV